MSLLSFPAPINFCDRLLYHDRPELLEDPAIPLAERFAIVERLGVVLRRSGYNRRFVSLLEGVLDPGYFKEREKPVSICDIGPGSGAILESVYEWATTHSLPVDLYGIDIDAEFGQLAQQRLAENGINSTFFCADATNLADFETDQFDFVYTSQMLHHIRSVEGVASVFREVDRISRYGYLISDLDRRIQGIPYMLASPLLGGTKMLTIDGIRSIRRAYHRTEIQQILDSNSRQYGSEQRTCEHYVALPYWWVSAKKY